MCVASIEKKTDYAGQRYMKIREEEKLTLRRDLLTKMTVFYTNKKSKVKFK
jgi:hypothetical protein